MIFCYFQSPGNSDFNVFSIVSRFLAIAAAKFNIEKGMGNEKESSFRYKKVPFAKGTFLSLCTVIRNVIYTYNMSLN